MSWRAVCFCLVSHVFVEIAVSQQTSCGMTRTAPKLSTHKIVGGQEAVPHSSPWMVGVYRLGRHWCGGTLINTQWIVTAAHCLDGKHRRLRSVTPENTSFFTVTLGDHRRSKAESTEQIRGVEKIVMNPSFELSNVNQHDIALVKLSAPVTLNEFVQPSCFADKTFSYSAGKRCIILGWGSTLSADSDDVLRQATVPLVSNSVCQSSKYLGRDFKPQSMVCAGYQRGGIDGCQRDSGGPLLCADNGKWFLAGVSSWGYGCALPYKPGVYTRVSTYSDWIKKTIS